MALALYKPGQGYWTRTLTAIGVATLVVAGVGSAWNQMSRFIDQNLIYYRAGMAIVVIALFAALTYYLVGLKPKTVDFMIATEAEMKKVNWPSRKEIIGSTIVVISGTLLLALILFVIDFFFGIFFVKIGILAPTE